MLQRKVPDREGLELGIAGLDAALVLLIQLAEADGHLAAAGAGGSDDDERAGGLDIVVLAEALLGVDEGDVLGIAFNGVMIVDLDAHAFQTLAVGIGAGLAVVMGDDHRTHHEAAAHELVAQAKDIHVIGDAEIAADLVLFNVNGTDDDDDLAVVYELREHLELVVRLEARQHAAGVVIVEKLASELHVELVAELGDAFLDMFGLDLEIFLRVEPVFHNGIQI